MGKVYKLSTIPSLSEYIAGLTAIQPRMSELQLRLLQEQYRAPKHATTATQLAELLGIESGRGAINLMYGRLGRLFCEAIGFKPSQRDVGTYRWWSVWSTGYEERNPYRFFWIMHSEVAEVLERLGWVDSISGTTCCQQISNSYSEPNLLNSTNVFPDEVTSEQIFREGAVRQVSVNAYERDPKARQKCIDYYGASCSVCNFNFGKAFGQLGEGFIHVHHLRPVSEIAEEYEVDPVKDLRPVCPNCHAMIHRRSPPLSIQEIQKILRTVGDKSYFQCNGSFATD